MSYTGSSSLFNDENQVYIRELYKQYMDHPDSVDQIWQDFFAQNGDALLDDGPSAHFLKGLPHARASKVMGEASGIPFTVWDKEDAPQKLSAKKVEGVSSALADTLRVDSLVNAYRRYAHLSAKLDPLHLTVRARHDELAMEKHGFEKADMDRKLEVTVFGKKGLTLKEVIAQCEKRYEHSIGVEYMHIPTTAERQWFIQNFEKTSVQDALSSDDRKDVLTQLLHADLFENYLDKKHRGTKRFGLDGGESLIVLLEQIFARGATQHLEEAVIGMAHRGRLNVLANVLRKPYHRMFAEFEGGSAVAKDLDVEVSGDVKYHLGYSCDRDYHGKKVHLSLMANPSHLECVNTVALGKVKAKLDRLKTTDARRVMGVLIHGDAAFIGQGIVAETFLLAGVEGYATGGTIHIAVNNQIGFTTIPSESRASIYCSDLAKMIDAPVFHVNGDDPEACAHVARLAMDYRQTFGKDVVIDMWCYRRNGHNEGDEPMYTQPVMYKTIKKQERTALAYGKNVEAAGLLASGTMDAITKDFNAVLDQEYALSKGNFEIAPDYLRGIWSSYKIPARNLVSRDVKTGVSVNVLKDIGRVLFKAPEGFALSNKVAKQFVEKQKTIEAGQSLDWATAELLAFGTLLQDGHKVRLSGEDCKRGTFSQRHAVLFDQDNNTTYTPINHMSESQEKLEVLNSPLSEFGVLGYEYGYSLSSPQALTIWEAQYGDFANGAQVIIDQFIASGETKWLRMSGLVMLLPHGFEGQGPEHSSARLERYLQLCAEDNMQVCNISTPANYFHALRRQMARDFQKPLVIMSPKSLFRHKLCVSDMADMAEGTAFKRVLLDHAEKDKSLVADDKIKRVILCTGKIYYELLEERAKQNIKDVYLLRVEQLYPFPSDAVEKELKRFKNAEIIWCQEEPKNNGSWFFVRDFMDEVIAKTGHKGFSYAGRVASASPATGYGSRHVVEQQQLIHDALGLK